MTSEVSAELDKLAAEYKRYGKIALIAALAFLTLFVLTALPSLLAIRTALPANSANNPAVLAAAGGTVAAGFAILITLVFPIYMLALGTKIKERRDYRGCLRGAEIIAFFRPYGSYLSEKTLRLLGTEEGKRAFDERALAAARRPQDLRTPSRS